MAMQTICRKNSKFTKLGLDYDLYSDGNFSKEVNLFINKIVDYKYFMKWHYYDFKRIILQVNFKDILRVLGYKFYEEKAYMVS